MKTSLEFLVDFIVLLRNRKIYYFLQSHRESVMVVIPRPDLYLEVEFFGDGSIEVQSFGPSSSVQKISEQEIVDLVKALD